MESQMLKSHTPRQSDLNMTLLKRKKKRGLKTKNKNKSEKIKGKELGKKDKKIKSFKNSKMK